jgi:hypothetical protein
MSRSQKNTGQDRKSNFSVFYIIIIGNNIKQMVKNYFLPLSYKYNLKGQTSTMEHPLFTIIDM